MQSEDILLYNSLKAIFLHIDNAEKAFLNQFKLSVPRFYLLMHIYNHPGINYIELSDLMLCTKSNTTRIVRSSQKKGLIDRRNHPDDGRSFQLFLTEAGIALFEQVYPKYVAHIQKLMSHFDEEEIRQYNLMSHTIENTLAKAIIGERLAHAEAPSSPYSESLQEQKVLLEVRG